MRRALVLSGGGSRGAYEIGAWQAFSELGVRFQAVYGTSAGAINAALFAQGDLEKASRLWENINIKQLMNAENEDFIIDSMISRKRDVIPFLIENAKHLQVDTAPMEAFLNAHLDEGAVRASGIDLGVMTVRVPQLSPAPMRLRDMEPGTLSNWVIASASCFPVFPMRKIDGDRYVDGGYFDNMPIDMAIADGADEIVAVDIHPQPTHPEYSRMPFLKMIHPLNNLGGFLDFNPRLLKRMRLMGYYDTMKAYGALDGIRYTFTRTGEVRVSPVAHRFMRRVASFDAETIRRVALHSSQPMHAPLISALEAETPLRKLDWKEVWLRGIELAAQAMEFREDAIYDPCLLAERILKFADSGERAEALNEKLIAETAKKGSRELLGLLVRVLRDHGVFPGDVLRTLADHPVETAAALALDCSREM